MISVEQRSLHKDTDWMPVSSAFFVSLHGIVIQVAPLKPCIRFPLSTPVRSMFQWYLSNLLFWNLPEEHWRVQDLIRTVLHLVPMSFSLNEQMILISYRFDSESLFGK